ncbi:MAG: hypothetical protein ACPGRC_06200 [Salibacteraceae bacterium]
MLTVQGFGQLQSNLRVKNISTQADTIYFDSLSVDPNSFSVSGVNEADYTVNYAEGYLVWQERPDADSIQINYRTWPVNISAGVSNKSTSIFVPDAAGNVNPFKYNGDDPQNVQFSTGKLDKTGSISRGVMFGNNQNLGVNSNLNLQLSGELTDNIKIKAVISDDNIPVQPDGNTQLLQDFDQVYIQLYNKDWKLVAGDFRINKPKSHFMKFDKRLRGGGGMAQFKINPKVHNTISVNAAVSRGKFSRNVFQGVEGNQGPYRLEGAENEAFIVILSGTEEVFIDGVKMTRGQGQDYVIDYNKAEVTFTANQPINKDKRIVVEFQYSAQAYSRSLIQVSDNIKTEKLNLNINLYSEKDNKNQPLLQDLTNNNIALLESIGDDVDNAIVSSIRQSEFSVDRVMYKLEVNPTTGDSVFVYSTSADSAEYLITFSNVGIGNGDYVEIASNANGRVFEYTPRVNGLPQGNFVPAVVLITPKKKEMYSAGGEYKLNRNSKLLFEGAITNSDVNTFSNEGNQNNVGGGFLVGYQNSKQVSNDTVAPWFMNTVISYENRTDNFEEIQRYRSVEFDRNWNIRGQNLTGMQHVPSVELGLAKKGLGKLAYQFKSFVSGESYQGMRHQLVSDLDNKKYTAKLNGSYLSSNGSVGSSTFNRHKLLLQKKYKNINLGFRDDFEHNLRKEPTTDSLNATSYKFFEWEAFITNGDSTKNKFRLGYMNRFNDAVSENTLARSTQVQSINGQIKLLANPKATFQFTSQYRVLEVVNNDLYTGDPEQNLTNRIDYSLRLLKGVVNLSSFYEVGSGLTEEQAYIYVEVPSGTGVYTWVDFNGNGVVEQDEFQIAIFQDQANFIRVVTQTNNFEKIYRTQFNQSIFLTPAIVWKNKKGIRKVLSHFSDQFAYRIDRKTDDNTLEHWINPLSNTVADSNVRVLNSSLRNTIYLNRSSRLWSMDYTYQEVNSKILQTNGLLGASDASNQLNFRYNMSRVYQINIEGKVGEKVSGSEFSSQRNYFITYSSIKPILTYLQGSGVKIKLFFEQKDKRNRAEFGDETNLSKQFGSELNVRKVGKGSLTISGSYLVNEFVGDINSPVAYQLLDGLQPGSNALWEVSYQRTIAKYLQLNLRYNGRVSEDSPVIHTGSVQVRAFF